MHFTEREFSGIFSLAGGILRFQNGNSRWPWIRPYARNARYAMSKTGIASLATEPVNLKQELDNGIIVIRQVKTVGYDVDKYTGKLLSLIGFMYVLQAKNQTWYT